jgi:hypothetical protein
MEKEKGGIEQKKQKQKAHILSEWKQGSLNRLSALLKYNEDHKDFDIKKLESLSVRQLELLCVYSQARDFNKLVGKVAALPELPDWKWQVLACPSLEERIDIIDIVLAMPDEKPSEEDWRQLVGYNIYKDCQVWQSAKKMVELLQEQRKRFKYIAYALKEMNFGKLPSQQQELQEEGQLVKKKIDEEQKQLNHPQQSEKGKGPYWRGEVLCEILELLTKSAQSISPVQRTGEEREVQNDASTNKELVKNHK